MVVDAKPDRVEAHVPERRGIRVGEEVFQELHLLTRRFVRCMCDDCEHDGPYRRRTRICLDPTP
jgi:hypothetical protein